MNTLTDLIHDPSCFFVPDQVVPEQALHRLTHLAIGAHQDDLEIFAYHGIEATFEKEHQWFGGVTVTNGSGCPRVGKFASCSDAEMVKLRHREQNLAAEIGKYAFQIQLGIPSAKLYETDQRRVLVNVFKNLVEAAPIEVLYVHQPLDRHSTHLAVFSVLWEALATCRRTHLPKQVLAGEVWGGLDAHGPEHVTSLPVDQYPKLEKALIEVYESQIEGGKNYLQGTLGRRRANATFLDPRQADPCMAVCHYLDLTSYVGQQEYRDWTKVAENLSEKIRRTQQDLRQKVAGACSR